MEAITIAVTLAQGSDYCLRLGKSLITKYRAYKHANDNLEELVLRVEGVWLKTELQIAVLNDIWASTNVRQRDFLEQCFQRLQNKLQVALVELSSLTGASNSQPIEVISERLSLDLKPLKKAKYLIFQKHLQKTVVGLETWHAIFDPMWYLISIRTSEDQSNVSQRLTESVPAELSQNLRHTIVSIRNAIQESNASFAGPISVFKTADFVLPERNSIPNTTLFRSKLAINSDTVILDTTAYPQEVDLQAARGHVRDLARLLSLSDPDTLGLPKCHGVLEVAAANSSPPQFQLIFAFPSHHTNPSSLRTLLLSTTVSLDVKYHLARSLARSITAVHTASFVHKNIRPETIAIFEPTSPQDLPAALLFGFERFRPSAARTTLVGDMVWHRNLYRHWTRQGIRPEEYYVMQHDIYSLGVVLLEIGLWESFVLPSLTPSPNLPITELLALSNETEAAKEIKNLLTMLASDKLPPLMGEKYTDVVMACLTCLDPAASNRFSTDEDLYDEDGILVGVTFIEEVLVRLQGIRI